MQIVTLRAKHQLRKVSSFAATFAVVVGFGVAQATPSGAAILKPNAPSNVSALAGNTQATVSWKAALLGGNPSSFTATASPGGRTCTTADGATLSCTVTGLTNGTSYTFTVLATNNAGSSSSSSASAAVTPATVPGAPASVTATPSDSGATVSWNAPASNGGAAITGYTATASPGGATCSTTGALTCDVTGLTNGTSYTFTVLATNRAGDSTASTPSSSVIPSTLPGGPTNVQLTAGVGQVEVSWSAPSDDGGSPITGYTVTASPGGATCSTTGALNCTVTGLTNGQRYSFTVVATNAAGSRAAAYLWGNEASPPSSLNSTTRFSGEVVSATSCVSATFCGVGGYYHDSSGNQQAFVSVFNGTTWTDTEVAGALNIGGYARVNSVSCTSATSCVAGGYYLGSDGKYQAFVSVLSDTTWTDTELAGALNAGGSASVNSVSCTSATSCVAGGSYFGSNHEPQPFVSVFNGTTWTDTEVAGALNTGGNARVNSVSCTSASSCVAGGNYEDSNGKVQAFVSVLSGTNWTSSEVAGDLNTGTNTSVNSVSCASATFCVAGGLRNGSSFVVMSTYPEVTLPSSPEPPSGVGASAWNASAVVVWSAPSDDGGATITGYVVTASPGGAMCTTTGALSCTVNGLVNGTTYTFTVTATNIVGTGNSSSPSAGVTPTAPVVVAPSAPGTPSLTDNHGSISLSWSAPTSDGGATVTYNVEELTNKGSWSQVATGLTSPNYTYAGTTAKSTYSFAIVAVNSAGRSGWSAAAYLQAVAVRPSVPGTPSLTDNHGSFTVTWSPSANNGGDVVTYKVEELTNHGSWSEVATGLTSPTYTYQGTTANNAYCFAIVAANSAGQSAWSPSAYLRAS